MKFFIHILILIWLIPITGIGQVYFDNYYNTGYSNVFSCEVRNTLDSNYVFQNFIIDSASNRQELGLIKLDKNGNELIKKKFNFFNLTYTIYLFGNKPFIDATPCSYFLAGGTNTGNMTYPVILSKVNRSTLDTIKNVMYSEPSTNYYLNNLIKLNDNKYLLIGNKGNSFSGVGGSLICILDSNLVITNSVSITIPNPNNFALYSAILNPVTKKILLHGVTSSGQYPVTLMHMDTLGTILTTSLTTSSFTRAIGRMYFSEFDTSYVMLGTKYVALSAGTQFYKLCITKYDKTLKMLWEKTYGDYALNNALSDCVILNDGSIVASGVYSKLTTIPTVNADYNGVILKVDKDGHFRWMQEFNHCGPGSQQETLFGIDQALDKGFILCGNVVMNQPHAQAWAIKTDSMGCLTPGCVSSTVTVDSLIIPKDTTVETSVHEFFIPGYELKVYPNPAGGDFVVETVPDEPKNLSICDLQGREIKQIVIKNKQTISASDLSPGIYLLQLYRDGQLLGTKKVVVLK